MFTEIDQQTLDIDWFFTNYKEIAFVASGGGKLPESIANSTDYDLITKFFKNLPEISTVIVNQHLSENQSIILDERYLADFMFMGKRGLFCYDKTILGNFSDSGYHLVATPSNPLKIDHLPDNVKLSLIKSVYNGDIGDYIDVSNII